MQPILIQIFLVSFVGMASRTYGQVSGDIRLSGGSCSGNLQIYLNAFPYGERWYQICDRNIGDEEAEVICRELGCPTGNAERKQASFGPYAFVFYITRGYQCSGTELSLSSCNQVGGQCISSSVDYGEPNDHVAIRCQSVTTSAPTTMTTAPTAMTTASTAMTTVPTATMTTAAPPGTQPVATDPVVGDVRLSEGCSGELQIYDDVGNNRGWYSICGAFFTNDDSRVVCRNLNCTVDGASFEFRNSQSSLPSLRASFYCTGHEAQLSTCSASLGVCSVSQTSTIHVQCGGAGIIKISSIILLITVVIALLLAM